MSEFIKIHLVVTKLSYADGRTGSNDEANSRSSQFCVGS